MRFGAAPTTRGKQSPEETRQWEALVKRYERNGGQGIAMDFVAEVVGVKREHEITFVKDGKRTITHWGQDTPPEVRTRVDDNGREFPMPEGCLITYALVDEKFGGLRFYKEGSWSGDDRTALFKTGNCIFPGQLRALDVDPCSAFIGGRLIITIRMEKAHDRVTEEGYRLKGGRWWGVTAFKPILIGDDEEEDAPGALDPTTTTSASGTSAPSASPPVAPAATTAAARSTASPISGNASKTVSPPRDPADEAAAYQAIDWDDEQ